jgi:hypothetical protein
VEHVVFFPAPDGTPAFRRLASLDDAVRFVEHLRNVENVAEASVYALTEVPVAFKAWYRVELPSVARSEAQPADAAPVPAPAATVELPAATDAPAAAPSTIAEAIETYAQAVPMVVPPAGGSATGIVVPDQPFVAVDQFGPPPVSALPVAAMPAPAAAQAAPPQAEPATGDAEILEPVFGVRRDRGLGFFAR